jgi:AmmeMemoRadiSam system protein A
LEVQFRIPEDDRRALLALARASVRDAILGDGSLPSCEARLEITPAMRISAGLFVTLKIKGEEGAPPSGRLRGCIGLMSSSRPLYETVIETAPKAALADPRFPPLPADELDAVTLSLSVLSPMTTLQSLDDLEIGRHGLQLDKGAYRAVFLPQVPVEQGWDTNRYLEQLALKAGLPKSGWRDAELATFEALTFSE